MTTMTIVDVVNMVYPDEQNLGNVAFGQDGSGPIFITRWAVPNEPEPTTEELKAMIPGLQDEFDLAFFIDYGTPQLTLYINQVAQEKGYESAVTCVSYVNSTVPAWQEQAAVFISWRDTVLGYTMQQTALMQQGSREIPTFDEFKTELPVIAWPD